MKIELLRELGIVGINAHFNVFEAQALISKSASILNATSLSETFKKCQKEFKHTKLSDEDRQRRVVRTWLGAVDHKEVAELFKNIEELHVFFGNMFQDTPAIQDVNKGLFTPRDFTDPVDKQLPLQEIKMEKEQTAMEVNESLERT